MKRHKIVNTIISTSEALNNMCVIHEHAWHTREQVSTPLLLAIFYSENEISVFQALFCLLIGFVFPLSLSRLAILCYSEIVFICPFNNQFSTLKCNLYAWFRWFYVCTLYIWVEIWAKKAIWKKISTLPAHRFSTSFFRMANCNTKNNRKSDSFLPFRTKEGFRSLQRFLWNAGTLHIPKKHLE